MMLDDDFRDVKFARVNCDTDGANEVVAAVTGKKIRVVAYQLTSTTTGLVTVNSAATALAELSLTAATAVPFAGSKSAPAFQTAAGEALNITVQASQDVNGHLAYVLVD